MPLEGLTQLIVRGLTEWALWKTTEESGWLPYHALPMDRVFGDGKADFEAFGDRLDAYYRAHGMDIVQGVAAAVASFDVDGEAKATLREALSAHEQGLYRASCRVLLPDIERVIREDWLGVKGVRTLNQKALMTVLKHIEIDDLAAESGDLVHLVGISSAFAWFKTLESPGPTPNRHAATHGWAVYSSEQDSLNTIICAEYVYRVATALKKAEAATQGLRSNPGPDCRQHIAPTHAEFGLLGHSQHAEVRLHRGTRAMRPPGVLNERDSPRSR